MSQLIFDGICNFFHVAYFKKLGYNIKQIEYSELNTYNNITLISDFFPEKSDSIFNGLLITTDLRLSGYVGDIMILSFLTKKQLETYDPHEILNSQGVHVLQLPIDHSYRNAIKQHQISEKSKPYDCKEIYIRRFQTLFNSLSHGKSFDLINTATGPLKSSCLLAKFYPEKEFYIWNKLDEVKQKIKKEYALQQLFFITNSKNAKFIGNESNSHFEFVNLLKKLSYTKEKEISIDCFVELIDNLNKAYIHITQHYG